MKIAYITYAGTGKYATANGFNEYNDSLPFLQQKALDITREVWDDPAVDWSKYQVALLKTPWDYHEKIDAFKIWLDKIEAGGVRLINDYSLVRWNLDKHYLKEIAAAGLAIIPSLFLDSTWTGRIEDLLEELGTERLIVKPCVSGGAKNTIVIERKEAAAAYPKLLSLLAEDDYIAQPMLKEIGAGEWSFVFFNGSYSHTILKKPKAGDFRVQQIHGGSIEPLRPGEQQIEKAAEYVRQFAKGSLYARVDGLMVDDRFLLMELELIEPFLYMSYGENAPDRYFRALQEKLST